MTKQTFERTYAIQIPLLLLEFKELNISQIRDKLNVKSRVGISSTIDYLKIHNLIDFRIEGNEKISWLTEKGEAIARKLSYAFDENKEVIPIQKELYTVLKGRCEDRKSGMTLEAFVNEILREYLISESLY